MRLGQALEHEAVEFGMRLPGLAGDDAAVADGLIGRDVVAAGRLDLQRQCSRR